MTLSEILSISGKPGLFTIISQTNNGLIVESVQDKKRIPVFSSHQVSVLEDISLYTKEDTLPMVDVMTRLFEHEKGEKSIDSKASKEKLEEKMETVFPEYDKDRVYHSDLKKLFKWYNLIIEYKLWNPEDEKEDEGGEKKADKILDKKDEKKPKTAAHQSAGKTAGSKAQTLTLKTKKG